MIDGVKVIINCGDSAENFNSLLNLQNRAVFFSLRESLLKF